MEGGTTFHFVTDGIEAALSGRAAAGDDDVIDRGRRQRRPAVPPGGLDRRDHAQHRPDMLGRGERLFDDLADLKADPVEVHASPKATHVIYRFN